MKFGTCTPTPNRMGKEKKERKKKKMRSVKGRQDINYICNTLLSSFLSEQIELIYGFGLIHIVSESEREGEVERERELSDAKHCDLMRVVTSFCLDSGYSYAHNEL